LFEVKRVVVGQDPMVERMIVGLLARGHVLLEGVPGVAKTLAVRTLADTFGGTFSRLQFTPDLMPADIVGTQVWRSSAERFDTELGPIFANLVLADEINRAPAKVQSALLEAMAERQVSIGGMTYPVPMPFLVLATQNPIETEGVYALPEAQRDRFLLKVDVDHAEELDELAILHRMSVTPPRAHQSGEVGRTAWVVVEVAVKRAAEEVGGEQVGPVVSDDRRSGGNGVEGPLQAGPHGPVTAAAAVGPHGGAGAVGCLGQVEQVGSFGLVQLERAGDRIKHAGGDPAE
jgi:MoxR-like ATPase